MNIHHVCTFLLPDMAEDQLAFDLAFLDGVLILTCDFRNLFGDVGIGFVDGHDAVFVGIGFSLQSFEKIIGEDTVAEVFPLLADFAGLAGGEHHSTLALRQTSQEIFRDDGAPRGRRKGPARRRAAIAGVGDENDAFRGEPLEDGFDLAHRQRGCIEVAWVGVVGHDVFLQSIVVAG